MDSESRNESSGNELEISVGPSQYRINLNHSACLSAWTIVLADNSRRDIFIANSVDGKCLNFDFNVHGMPIVGISPSWAEEMQFVRYHGSDEDQNSVTFGPSNMDAYNVFVPKIAYHFSDLSFKIEMALDNLSSFPLCWCPVLKFLLHLPWHDNLSLDQYSLNSRAKKKLLLNGDYEAIESSKCTDKIQLNSTERNILAVANTHDQKIRITTKNEEEAVSISCPGKFPNLCFGLKQTANGNCSELLCLSAIPNSKDDQNDWSRHRNIQPGKSDVFSIEVSLY